MFRFGNKSKEALGGLFLNLCALTYAGVVLEKLFIKDGDSGALIIGFVLSLLFCCIGIILVELSNERRW